MLAYHFRHLIDSIPCAKTLNGAVFFLSAFRFDSLGFQEQEGQTLSDDCFPLTTSILTI